MVSITSRLAVDCLIVNGDEIPFPSTCIVGGIAPHSGRHLENCVRIYPCNPKPRYSDVYPDIGSNYPRRKGGIFRVAWKYKVFCNPSCPNIELLSTIIML